MEMQCLACATSPSRRFSLSLANLSRAGIPLVLAPWNYACETHHRSVFGDIERSAFELLAGEVGLDIIVHGHVLFLPLFFVNPTLGPTCPPFQSPVSFNSPAFREEPKNYSMKAIDKAESRSFDKIMFIFIDKLYDI